MDEASHALITALHSSPFRYVLALTGGGASAASQLLAVPGGSRTILEVSIPYGEKALADFLGRQPTSFCSIDTAHALAARAWERARRLDSSTAVAGVGCTASLRTDRPKRGEHRFHIAVQTIRAIATHSLTLTKEARDREGEEAIVARVLLNAMAEAFGVQQRLPLTLLPGEEVARKFTDPSLLAKLLTGACSTLCVEPDGRMRSDTPPPLLLMSGSFNPLHHGHSTLAKVAASLVGTSAAFELSVVNADKPALSDEEILRRLSQFAWSAPVWLTRAATFQEKANLFPGATFVVGADTAARIVMPRFYGNSETNRDAALANFRARGCRFLVAGRISDDGRFVGPDDLAIPAIHRDLFSGIPETTFRLDVSSTQLRTLSGN